MHIYRQKLTFIIILHIANNIIHSQIFFNHSETVHYIPADQYLPSGRGEFTVRGVAEALEFTSLAIATIKKEKQAMVLFY